MSRNIGVHPPLADSPCSATKPNSKALQIQSDAGASFKQIQYIVRWDLSLTYLSLGDYINANESLSILAKESNWSKAVYSYGQAVTMYEVLQRETVNTADEEAEVAIRKLQIREIMKTIPGFVQRIAGKSLPFEVRNSKGNLCNLIANH